MSGKNLFTPALGKSPQVFFGRETEISFVRSAFENQKWN